MKARPALAAAAALLCFALGACGSSGSGSPRATGSPASTGPGSPSRSSTPSASTVNKVAGQVVVHVPTRHSTIGVVVLHSFAHGPAQLVAEGWNAVSDRYGFIAIYPTRGGDWNAGLCCGAAAKSNRDDVGWLTKEIRLETAKYHLTTVYLAGESNGGMMVERLVAQEPTLTSRFVIWAGAPEWETPSNWAGTGYLFHGSNDAQVPIRGGTVRIGGILVRINPSERARQFLPNAHLTFVTVPGFGHAAPPYWPKLAWAALATGATAVS